MWHCHQNLFEFHIIIMLYLLCNGTLIYKDIPKYAFISYNLGLIGSPAKRDVNITLLLCSPISLNVRLMIL